MAETIDSDRANEVAVLVPAAGEGSRMGGTRKQFRELGQRPLMAQTLMAFERHAGVGHLVVAVPENEVREVSDMLQAEGISKLTAVVSGGDSRRESVRNALRAVPAPVEVVLVHDAVRPFVRAQHVAGVIDAVREHGAAALAVPVADTLRRAGGEIFAETVDRTDLHQMQTPQGFRRAWLEKAHRRAEESASEDDVDATDDVELVQRAGHDVHLVPGSRRNVKITTPSDWAFAQDLWAKWEG
jgi:2-C-methyl-D-erythritol 4-phosphate cytidylyltransferase